MALRTNLLQYVKRRLRGRTRHASRHGKCLNPTSPFAESLLGRLLARDVQPRSAMTSVLHDRSRRAGTILSGGNFEGAEIHPERPHATHFGCRARIVNFLDRSRAWAIN